MHHSCISGFVWVKTHTLTQISPTYNFKFTCGPLVPVIPQLNCPNKSFFLFKKITLARKINIKQQWSCSGLFNAILQKSNSSRNTYLWKMKTSPLGALDWLIMSESPGSFNSRYSLTSQSKARRVLRKVSQSFSSSFLSFPWAADCFKFTLPRRLRDCANLASSFPLRHSRKWLKAKCTAVPSSGTFSKRDLPKGSVIVFFLVDYSNQSVNQLKRPLNDRLSDSDSEQALDMHSKTNISGLCVGGLGCVSVEWFWPRSTSRRPLALNGSLPWESPLSNAQLSSTSSASGWWVKESRPPFKPSALTRPPSLCRARAALSPTASERLSVFCDVASWTLAAFFSH